MNECRFKIMDKVYIENNIKGLVVDIHYNLDQPTTLEVLLLNESDPVIFRYVREDAAQTPKQHFLSLMKRPAFIFPTIITVTLIAVVASGLLG